MKFNSKYLPPFLSLSSAIALLSIAYFLELFLNLIPCDLCLQQRGVHFLIILASIPSVYADDDWIDGIKIRVGHIDHKVNVSMSDGSEHNIFGTNKEFSHLKILHYSLLL